MYKPFFSIVNTVYIGKRFLSTNIKNIVNKNFKGSEYIILDGNLTDNTHNIIKKYKKKCIFNMFYFLRYVYSVLSYPIVFFRK